MERCSIRAADNMAENVNQEAKDELMEETKASEHPKKEAEMETAGKAGSIETEAEEKPKTRRRRTVKKAAASESGEKAAEEPDAKAEEGEEKPKTRRRRTVKKTAAESGEKPAEEPDAKVEEGEEKPKTRRRRTVKKAASENGEKSAEEPETKAEEGEEKPKTRRRKTVKKVSEKDDAAEAERIGMHKVVASGNGAVIDESASPEQELDPAEAEKEHLKERTERRRRSEQTAGCTARVKVAGSGEKSRESEETSAADEAQNKQEAPSGRMVFSSFHIGDAEYSGEDEEQTGMGDGKHDNAAPEQQIPEGSVSETHSDAEAHGEHRNHEEHTHHKREHREYSPEERPEVTGILDIVEGGFGFLRFENFMSSDQDIYVSPTQIRRFNLKTGDEIYGISRRPGQNEKFGALLYVKTVNGDDPGTAIHRPQFESLTPIFPDERLRLEDSSNDLSVRLIDLVAPIGKGQRGMIVAPPKAGKTTLLKSIARSLEENHPEVSLFVLLVDERPEEVTDMKRTLKHGQVIYSTFDEMPQHHVKVAEMMLARAKRLAEHGKDVVILLDSLTRLTRAYNLVVPASGRTLSGGIDPGAFYGPKRFFGAARNIEHGGSITILATALVDTGSRMDDVIFEEFKGTGNMELHLDRKLSEKRIFPAIDIYKSGTRREELLMSQEELEAVWTMRRAMSNRSTQEVTEEVIDNLAHTRNNRDFIEIIRKVFYQEQK
jgi:transcription termination factor Rho